MSEDKTFCFNTKCKNEKCERNAKNIQQPNREHSFAYFKECEHWDMPETYYTPSEADNREW